MRCVPWKIIQTQQLPEVAAFSAVVTRTREVLGNKDPAIVWAVMHGSAFTDELTRVSDLDLVVCLASHDEFWGDNLVFKKLRRLAEFAYLRHVPLEIRPISEPELRAGNHTFGPGFRSHLIASANAGSLVKGNISYLNDIRWCGANEAQSYLASKANKAKTMLLQPPQLKGSDTWYDFLSDILTVPKHAIRRVCECSGLKEASTAELETFFFQLNCPNAIKQMYRTLQNTRQHYLQQVGWHIEYSRLGHGDEAGWQTVIADVEQTAYCYHSFLVELGLSLVST